MAEMIHLLLLLPIIVFLFLMIVKGRSSAGPPLPPGPHPWPIVGNLFQLRKTNPHVPLAELAKTHGPLMSLRNGHRILVVGSSPAAAAEILKAHDQDLSGRDVTRLFKGKDSKVHNTNLVFSDECNDRWRVYRNLYRSELFSAKALETQVERRERRVSEMVKFLGRKVNERVVIRDVVFTTALNILGDSFLSMDLVDFEGKGVGSGLMDAIRRLSALAGRPQWADLYPFLGGLDLERWYKKAMHIMQKELWGVWESTLQTKRQASDGPMDFSDILIQKGFTDHQIHPILQELFAAGTDTTGATVEWVLVELLRNQNVLQKLVDELTQQIHGTLVKESDLPKLPYLQACFKETLRLHPPAPLLIPHRAVKTCQIMGFTVPKDSQILVNVWAIGRDPRVWDDPLSFKPERFMECDVSYMGKDFRFVPFSSGRRMCPGQPLASKTVPVMLASLILNFEWVLPDKMKASEIDMEEDFDFSMRKRQALHLTIKLRDRS